MLRLVGLSRGLMVVIFGGILFLSTAADVLADDPPQLYYSPVANPSSRGYDNDKFDTFSQAVRAIFGLENITEVTDFSAVSSVQSADAIIVNLRFSTDTLSTAEQTNLLAFINQGKPLLFIGDHASWEVWDESFIGLFGDEFEGRNNIVNTGIVTGDPHPLHVVADTLQLSHTGTMAGGNARPLYRISGGQIMAGLYGPRDNAVAFLDSNVFGGAGSGNTQFAGRFADWFHAEAIVASQIPEPTTAALLSLAALTLLRRRRAA